MTNLSLIFFGSLALLTSALPTNEAVSSTQATNSDLSTGPVLSNTTIDLSDITKSTSNDLVPRAQIAFFPFDDINSKSYGYMVPLDGILRQTSNMRCYDSEDNPGTLMAGCPALTVKYVGPADALSPSICCQAVYRDCFGTKNILTAGVDVKPPQVMDLLRCQLKTPLGYCGDWPESKLHNHCGDVPTHG